MDFINLPLILVSLCFIGIVVYIIDFFIWRKPRLEAIANLKSEHEPINTRQKKKALKKAIKNLHIEPGWVKEIRSLLPIVLVVTILRSFIVEPFQIPSSSMEPSLNIGDFILVNKYTYGIRLPVIRDRVVDINEPQRGDVMVFFPPHDKRYFIKRVIGISGDVVEYKDKVLYINGEKQPQIKETYTTFDPYRRKLFTETLNGVEHSMFTIPSRPIENFSVKVKPGHYFMMGDNRDNSSDSRVWGQVPEANIVGKAYAVWMHWESWTSLPSFKEIRWIQ